MKMKDIFQKYSGQFARRWEQSGEFIQEISAGFQWETEGRIRFGSVVV